MMVAHWSCPVLQMLRGVRGRVRVRVRVLGLRLGLVLQMLRGVRGRVKVLGC